MSKPELIPQRPLRPDEFHFSAPVVGGSGAEQLSGYARLGAGITPCVDMTIVLPDGLPLSVVSVEVSLFARGTPPRPWVSVSFAPLQPGEAQQARDAMRSAGWVVTGTAGAGRGAEDAEPSADDLDDLEADAQAEGTDDDDEQDEPAPPPLASRKQTRAGGTRVAAPKTPHAERKPAAAKAKAKPRR